MERFFMTLPTEAAETMRRVAVPRSWPAGATLFHAGDPAEGVLVLERGHVKITTHSAGGIETILAIRGPGDLIGELSTLDGGARVGSAVAIQDTTCLVLTTSRFHDLLGSSPAVAAALLRELASRLREADGRRAEFAVFDATTRVARRLVELAISHGAASGGDVRLSLPISQAELAALAGASLEATGRALRTLRAEGLLSTGRRRLTLHDVPRLRVRADLR